MYFFLLTNIRKFVVTLQGGRADGRDQFANIAREKNTLFLDIIYTLLVTETPVYVKHGVRVPLSLTPYTSFHFNFQPRGPCPINYNGCRKFLLSLRPANHGIPVGTRILD